MMGVNQLAIRYDIMKRTFSFIGILLIVTSTIHAQQFAVIGDYGIDSPEEGAVADMIKGWEAEFVITLGDNNYPFGEDSTIDKNIGKYYHDFIFPYHGSYGAGATENNFFPTLGNHDDYTDNGDPYLAYFELPGNERYYDFVKGDIHFFALNSTEDEPDGNSSASVQAQWLQNRIEQSTSKWKLVYFHHPPYSTGDHGDTEYMQWPFEKWGATAVLSGHDHIYERIQKNGIPYVVNGVGGNTLYEFDPEDVNKHDVKLTYNQGFGAMKVIANKDSIHFEFHSITHGVIDQFTIKDGSQQPLFSSDELLEITIETNLEELLADRSEERSYHNARISIMNGNEQPISLEGKLKARGHFRRDEENCAFAPFWIKFKKEDVQHTVFKGHKRLKIVNPCDLTEEHNQFIMQEYLGYRIYNVLTDSSFRVRPVKINYVDKATSATHQTFSFFIEDSERLGERLYGEEVTNFGGITQLPNYHNPPTMELFQYMIGNDDWGIPDHNMKVFKLNDNTGNVMVPYDFDLSHIVNAEYAYLDRERKAFRGFCHTKNEFMASFRMFNDKKQSIKDLYDHFDKLDPLKKEQTLKFIERFYRTINSAEKRKTKIFDHCSDEI
jgi:hypothetical protein